MHMNCTWFSDILKFCLKIRSVVCVPIMCLVCAHTCKIFSSWKTMSVAQFEIWTFWSKLTLFVLFMSSSNNQNVFVVIDKSCQNNYRTKVLKLMVHESRQTQSVHERTLKTSINLTLEAKFFAVQVKIGGGWVATELSLLPQLLQIVLRSHTSKLSN